MKRQKIGGILADLDVWATETTTSQNAFETLHRRGNPNVSPEDPEQFILRRRR